MEKLVKIEAFIPDKRGNISKVLEALDGIALQVSILPVRNAKANGGKLTEAGHPTSGADAVRKAIAEAASQGFKEITLKWLIDSAQTYGFGKSRVMASINALKANGVLKQKGRGTYSIVQPKE